jgi:hypothetical protein
VIFVLDRFLSVNCTSLNGDSGAFGPLPVHFFFVETMEYQNGCT